MDPDSCSYDSRSGATWATPEATQASSDNKQYCVARSQATRATSDAIVATPGNMESRSVRYEATWDTYEALRPPRIPLEMGDYDL